MLPFERYQRFCTFGVLTTGMDSLALMPATAGLSYVVVNGTLTCLVSAAGEAYLGDSSGSVKALNVADSFTTHAQARVELKEGLELTKAEALILSVVTSGPSFHVVAEGYILKDSSNIATTA